MNVIKTTIEGVVVIEPKVFKDSRGYFVESFSQREFDEKVAIPQYGKPILFVQDNESMSSYGVMRGLHFQLPPFTQSKLVRCFRGKVLDVAVDIRKGSPTYGHHVAVELTEDNHRQLFVPRGFAAMALLFSVKPLSSSINAITSMHHRQMEASPLRTRALVLIGAIPMDKVILSEKDTQHECLKDFTPPL